MYFDGMIMISLSFYEGYYGANSVLLNAKPIHFLTAFNPFDIPLLPVLSYLLE